MLAALLWASSTTSCGKDDAAPFTTVSPGPRQGNMARAMDLIDATVANTMQGDDLLLSEYYNPFTNQVQGTGGSSASIYRYTAVIEGVNAVMSALQAEKTAGNSANYDANYTRYEQLLAKLYEKARFYRGTFALTSFTQKDKEWRVYAVPRAAAPDQADVAGINNVYDDQMWLIRELLNSYRITQKQAYLDEAEYLTAYCLDGWDCTIRNGAEQGGISWGPGYTTKHTCSNGPLISPLVWLSEIYEGKADQTTYHYIDPTDGTSRKQEQMNKSEYYLMFARKVYDWTQQHLRDGSGIYWDMLGIDGGVYHDMTGYRGQRIDQGAGGKFYVYNAGSVLSGVCDLVRVTGDEGYKDDAIKLAKASYERFRQEGSSKPGYDTWSVGLRTEGPWDNGVLARAFAQCAGEVPEAAAGLASMEKNLNYAYDNYYKNGFLPTNLVAGWGMTGGNNNVHVMNNSSFAAQFALMAELAQ